MFGGERNIPDSVKDAMLLKDYDRGKPLTARRILAVKAAIDRDGTVKRSLDKERRELQGRAAARRFRCAVRPYLCSRRYFRSRLYLPSRFERRLPPLLRLPLLRRLPPLLRLPGLMPDPGFRSRPELRREA